MEGNALVIPGGANYRVLILENEVSMSLDTAVKLADFAKAGLPVLYVGSATGRPDFYRNNAPEARALELTVAASGSPEIWNAWTGEIQPALDFGRTGKSVRMRMELPPYGSELLVFDPADRHLPRATPPAGPAEFLALNQGWTLRAAGTERKLDRLIDWGTDAELKGFSGKAMYATRFPIDAATLQKHRSIYMDLGNVKAVAEIRMNGKIGPVLLLRPYRAEITKLVQAGENTVEISITNGLTNRMLAQGVDLTGFQRFRAKGPAAFWADGSREAGIPIALAKSQPHFVLAGPPSTGSPHMSHPPAAHL